MRRPARRSLILLATTTVLAVVVARSWVVVDESESVLVTEFGRVVARYDPPEGAGFRLKWPWRSRLAIDRRLRVFDPPAREMITGDKRNIEAASYVAWRVADPEQFLRAAGTPEAAEARLAERVAAALSDAVGRRDLAALASTDPDAWGLDDLTAEVHRAIAPAARAELGIAVVDVRLRRFLHPVEVRPAVFDLIRSERRQVAATLRAEGEAEYQHLTSQADRRRDAILADADAEAERLRGRGDAEATRVLNEAHGRDPAFAEFLRTLEAYRALLDERTTIVLSSASPLLRLLTQGPPGVSPGEDRPTSSPTPEPARAAGVLGSAEGARP